MTRPEKRAFENIVVTSIFSFSQNVFYPSQNKFDFLSSICFVVCKYFQFGRVKQIMVWYRVKLLTHYQTTNFRLFQTERVCRRQISNLTKMAKSYGNLLKTLWENEKLLVTSNFSFSLSVFKRLVSQGCQKVLLCGNGLTKKFHVFKSLIEGGNLANLVIQATLNLSSTNT